VVVGGMMVGGIEAVGCRRLIALLVPSCAGEDESVDDFNNGDGRNEWKG